MIVNVSSKDIKYASFQHVTGSLFIPFSQPAPSFSLINICSSGLWPISYGLENKPLWNKQAAGRLWHFSSSSWRAQVMDSCLPNEGYLFMQKAGYGHRLLLNIVSCQITCDDWKCSPYHWEDNGLLFKKCLVPTPLITVRFSMIHSTSTWESSTGRDTETTNSLYARSSGCFAWVNIHMNMWNRVRVQRAEWTISV